MKKNTYPVAENAQAQKFREIFDIGLIEGGTSSSPGRIYGINNSPNLKKLFPQSPLYDGGLHTKANSTNTDRGKFFENIKSELTSHLTNEIISDMFAYVVDGSQNKMQAGVRQPHIQYEGEDNNYNWLYRDQPMDMNFNYLKPTSPNSKEFIKSSPDANTAPVGSNAPINNPELKDQPFWGHANLQVPSIDPFAQRQVETTLLGTKLPQLIRGSGGFGTNYPISNRPFASQEKIGQYFSNTYVNDEQAGGVKEGEEVDRMGYIAGKSIISSGDNQPTGGNSAYKGDISPLGTVIDQAIAAAASQSTTNLTPTSPRLI